MPITSPNHTSSPFILLIEDNKKDIALVKNNLAEGGVLRNHLSACQSIKEAIHFLKEHTEFSTILLDLSVSDGIALSGLKTLKKNFPDKIILVFADKTYHHLGIESIKAGAQEFLLKEQLVTENIYPIIQFAVERAEVFKQEANEKLRKIKQNSQQLYQDTVSYTHLTLPTICSV